MNIETKVSDRSGTSHDYRIVIELSSDDFVTDEHQFIVTASRYGVLVKPYFKKKGAEE